MIVASFGLYREWRQVRKHERISALTIEETIQL